MYNWDPGAVCCDALQTGWGKVDDMVIPVPNPQQLVSNYFTKIVIVMSGQILHTMARCVLLIVYTWQWLEKHYSMLYVAQYVHA